jgi:hypothetical protein
MTPAEQKILADVTQEAAVKATEDIRKREASWWTSSRRRGSTS